VYVVCVIFVVRVSVFGICVIGVCVWSVFEMCVCVCVCVVCLVEVFCVGDMRVWFVCMCVLCGVLVWCLCVWFVMCVW